jgi:hypothetical protein
MSDARAPQSSWPPYGAITTDPDEVEATLSRLRVALDRSRTQLEEIKVLVAHLGRAIDATGEPSR